MTEQPPSDHLKQLYDEEYVRKLASQEEPRRLRAILRCNPPPSEARVLDVGCGTGALAAAIGSQVALYDGVDFSEAFIEVASSAARARRQDNCRFHHADVIEFISANRGRYDRLYALDISEHVPDEQWMTMVTSFKEALRPGGQVIVHTPNENFFIEKMKSRGIMLAQFPEHVAVRDASANASFFERAGFASVHVRYLPHYNVLRYLHVLSHASVIGRYFAARLLITSTL